MLKTEDNSKTLFGQYNSKRLKEWNDLLRSFEKDNLFLADAAHTFIELINYEM